MERDKEARVMDKRCVSMLYLRRGVCVRPVFFRVEDAGVNLTMGVAPFDKGRYSRSDRVFMYVDSKESRESIHLLSLAKCTTRQLIN